MGTESRWDLQHVVRVLQPELGAGVEYSSRAGQQHPTWRPGSRAARVLPDRGTKQAADVCLQGGSAGQLAQGRRPGLDAYNEWLDAESLRLAQARLYGGCERHLRESWSPTRYRPRQQEHSSYYYRSAEGPDGSHWNAGRLENDGYR